MAYTGQQYNRKFKNSSTGVSPIGVTTIGSFVNSYELPEFVRATIKQYRGLVLVREKVVGNRCWGTLWSRGKVLCFTVEDIPRDKKKDEITAIPASDDASWEDSRAKGDTIKVNPGAYYINLKSTSNNYIKESYVKLNVSAWDKEKQSWKQKNMNVVPIISTSLMRKSSSTAKKYGNEGLVIDDELLSGKVEGVSKGFGNFDGVRIHHGTSEKSSEGCIIVSRTRKSDGTLVKDIGCAQQLTKYIHNMDYYKRKALVIFDAYKMKPPVIKKGLKGKIKNGLTGDSLKLAKVLYPDTVKKYK